MIKLSLYLADKLDKLGKPIHAEDYAFLDKTPELHTPILIGLGGSHAYGTSLPTSDMDIRGVAMHSKKDILLGQGFEQVINEATDTTIYSLKKVVSLLMNCNPNIVEMMGLKPEHYLYVSKLGQSLLDNKDMFLSNKCVGSFMGYANQQMYRLQQKSLAAMSPEQLNAHVVKTLNGMQEMLEEHHGMYGVEAKLKDGQIVLSIHVDDYPAENLAGALGALNNTIRDYNKNSSRNEKALAHGKIAKHSMHLLRLYMMCEDMLLYGEVNTYREKEHDLLMSIRNGDYLGEDGKPTAEFYDIVHDYESRMDYAKAHSVLPDKPDMKRIEAFLMRANEQVISEKPRQKERD